MRYDEVVQRLVDTCEQDARFSAVASALVVRTVDGRVRLALDTSDEGLRATLDAALSVALERWFLRPVVATQTGPRALRRVATELLRTEREWPESWPEVTRGADERSVKWDAMQVVRAKDSFLAPSESTPAWPMVADATRITAFYGFKGGVGRTTTLAVVAWLLAAQGKRVTVIDLDLESPGLGHALEADHRPTDGLLDYLVTFAIEGTAPLPVRSVQLHGATLQLIAAGPLDGFFVEKLARLDLVHQEDGGRGPVYAGLVALLKRLRSDGVDHILLDCRSGLHDLAGLALHDLAHVDVFVGRGDRQELDGLRPLLTAWRKRRSVANQRMLVLRTLRELPLREERTVQQRAELYDLLRDVLYDGLPPDQDARGAAHDPCPVGLQQEIANAGWLGNADVSSLTHATFGDVLARLEALWAPEST